MKNTKNYSFRQLSAKNAVQAEAVNVRQSEGRMVAVGSPAAVCPLMMGDVLLGVDRRGNTTYYFLQRNHRSVILAGYRTGSTYTAVNETLFDGGGDVTAMASTAGFVVMATPKNLQFLHYNGSGYTCLGGMVQPPSFCFGTSSTASVTTDIAGATLKGSYSTWNGTLKSADRSTAKKDFTSAIEELQRTASAGGYCLRPVALRVALRLWDDSRLWSNEAQCVGRMWTPDAVAEATPGGEWVIADTTLTASMWQPTIRLTDSGIGEWQHLVKSVEIYATDEDTDFTTMRFRCEQTQTGTKAYSLRYRAEADEAAAIRKAAEATQLRLVATITDVDALLKGKIRGKNITDTGGDAYTLSIVRSDGYAKWENAPREFTPQVLTAIGTNVFAGNITATLPQPAHFLSLVDGTDLKQGVASSYVSVDLATSAGTATICRAELLDRYSLTSASLLSYPDNRARQLTMTVVAGGKRYSVTVSLSPAPSGNYAYATGAVTLAETDDTSIPSTALSTTKTESLLMVSDAGNPLQWTECPRADNTGVVAVLPSLRYGSSWVLGRSPVCLFSADGLRLLSFSSAGECTASTRISHRTVNSPLLAVTTEGGVAFVDTHGELCRYESSRVRSTGIDASSAKGLVYSSTMDEVIAYGGKQAIAVSADDTFTHRTLSFASHAHNMPFDVGNVYTVDEETDGQTAIELRSEQIPSPTPLHLAQWLIEADDAVLTATVYADRGISCHGMQLSSLHLNGYLRMPVRQRVASPRVRSVRLSLTGSLPSGSAVHGVALS